MRVKRIDIIKREDGFFHPENKPKIKAYKHGEGYGVMVFFEVSPIDSDFGEYAWCPKAEELKRMTDMMHETDHLTFPEKRSIMPAPPILEVFSDYV